MRVIVLYLERLGPFGCSFLPEFIARPNRGQVHITRSWSRFPPSLRSPRCFHSCLNFIAGNIYCTVFLWPFLAHIDHWNLSRLPDANNRDESLPCRLLISSFIVLIERAKDTGYSWYRISLFFLILDADHNNNFGIILDT